jgi:hypothetical protein
VCITVLVSLVWLINIFTKKFYEYPFSSYTVVAYGETDMAKLTGKFLQLSVANTTENSFLLFAL